MTGRKETAEDIVGSMTAMKPSGTSGKANMVKLKTTQLPRRGSRKVPEYARLFSEQASRGFHQKYRTYEAAVAESN